MTVSWSVFPNCYNVENKVLKATIFVGIKKLFQKIHFDDQSEN